MSEKQQMYKEVDEEVDAWFNETIHNSPASQNTDSYNVLFKAKEDLKKRLIKVVISLTKA